MELLTIDFGLLPSGQTPLKFNAKSHAFEIYCVHRISRVVFGWVLVVFAVLPAKQPPSFSGPVANSVVTALC
jgi:hypothetical protein